MAVFVVALLSTMSILYSGILSVNPVSKSSDIEIKKFNIDISLQNARIGLGYAAIGMAGFISLLFAH